MNVVKVMVTGTEDQVEKAKSMIREKIDSFRSREGYNADGRSAPLNRSRWGQELPQPQYSKETPRIMQPMGLAAACQPLQDQMWQPLTA